LAKIFSALVNPFCLLKRYHSNAAQPLCEEAAHDPLIWLRNSNICLETQAQKRKTGAVDTFNFNTLEVEKEGYR